MIMGRADSPDRTVEGERPMILSPTPIQGVALALGMTLPLVLLVSAQLKFIQGAGTRYLLVCLTSALMFFAAIMVLPFDRDWSDVISGFLLLMAAMLFWNVFWNLLAFGFTLTLLTALARCDLPLTRDQWISAYMQGGDLQKFARNRLQLLLGTGMARIDESTIVATPFGKAAAGLVRLIRLFYGVR
jgi:hypothetical protein